MFFNRLVAKYFESRGLTEEDLKLLECANHSKLQGTDEFIDFLDEWKLNKSHVTILPDFDMDGITSGTVLYAGLNELGIDAELFMPSVDGYGITVEDIDRLMIEHPHTDVILTCDGGIGDVEALTYAKKLGLCVVVTDHHMEIEGETVRGSVDLVIDPCSVGETYEHPGICGAHVAWQCLDEYAHHTKDMHNIDAISRLRVFAGIGTISDMMPLLYENRQLVRDAVALCRMSWSNGSTWFVDALHGCEKYKRAFYGLFNFFNVFYHNSKIENVDDIDEDFFGFYMAPTFNSIKRMNGDISRAFGVFIDDINNQENHVYYLNHLNEKRKEITKEWLDKMLHGVTVYEPYIYICDAPAGIKGLLANARMNQTGLPCLVVGPSGEGGFHGSGRSPIWYPFITQTKDIDIYAKGHEGAFGVGFENLKNIDDVFNFVCSDVDAALADAPELAEPVFDFTIATDGRGDVGIDVPLFQEFLEAMSLYVPFGQEFSKPNIELKFDVDEDGVEIRRMGAEKQHLKFILPYGFEVIAWNEGERADALHGEVRMSGNLEINKFMGKMGVQFKCDRFLD